jgi:hypothetical protein
MPDCGFHFVLFCKLEVPKMWENVPVFYSPVPFVFKFPQFKLKAWFLMLALIVVMCFNNRQLYVHGRFHDQFV